MLVSLLLPIRWDRCDTVLGVMDCNVAIKQGVMGGAGGSQGVRGGGRTVLLFCHHSSGTPPLAEAPTSEAGC